MKALMVGLGAVQLIAVIWGGATAAAAGGSVVISHVQPGATGESTQEFIALYNNSDQPVDISHWCLTNKRSTVPLVCLDPDAPDERYYLPTSSYAVLASGPFVIAYPENETRHYDAVFDSTGNSGAITGSSDDIGIHDTDDQVIDLVTWTATPGSGNVWQRLVNPLDPLYLLDTDAVNMVDFIKTTTTNIPVSGLQTVRVIPDMCGILDGIQESMPPGYGFDEAGNCELLSSDLCNNLSEIQLVIPDGYTQVASGGCYIDVCTNLDGVQQSVPDGYVVEDESCSKPDDRPIIITEVFANAAGSDTGREFVELYNPNDAPVQLNGYQMRIGKELEKTIALPTITLGAGDYIVLSDIDLKTTLLNSMNQLAVVAPAGVVVSETTYNNSPENESWVLIDDAWQYTDQSTPGEKNLARAMVLDDESGVTIRAQAPCGDGKYRHPITNRCRSIESDTVMLVACGSDEYRNPETNRCRKAAVLAASLVPCREGYERSPETNRCRSLATTTSTLKACQTGYERNPTTNRCRKVLAAATAVASGSIIAPDAKKSAAVSSNLGGALLATVAVGAVGYGLYEWRQELSGISARMLRLLTRR